MNLEVQVKNILVAPLNWGIGHATRCIPIIRGLEKNGFTPVLASDGGALDLLRKEFPHLTALELPSYKIKYSKNSAYFKWKMLQNLPAIAGAILKEKYIVKKWIDKYSLVGIISDNRPGVYSTVVPSVYITHQLNVLTGNTSWFSSKMHQYLIQKFDECWVPDWQGKPNLTGMLGHSKIAKAKIKYIGPLSRFEKSSAEKKYDLMILLSGPEPQRGMWEKQLRKMIVDFEGKVVFICGIIEQVQSKQQENHVTYYNFMITAQLQKTFNESELVLCRAGYTTIMDLVKMNKKAFLIPTPGQFEQEYLAEKLSKDRLFSSARQQDFKLEDLPGVQKCNGFPEIETAIERKLFRLFERK